jgi:hypothetical protein
LGKLKTLLEKLPGLGEEQEAFILNLVYPKGTNAMKESKY